MSFILTIRGIPDKELGRVFANISLPRAARYDISHTPDPVALIEGPKNGKRFTAKGDTILTMTGKVPSKKGLKLKDALTVFEKLEAKEGIGTVSVDMFRNALTDRAMHFRLVHENYLDYLQ